MARHELNIQQPAFQHMLQDCDVSPSLFGELIAQMDLPSSASFVEFDLGDFAHRIGMFSLSSRHHLPYGQLRPRREAPSHQAQADSSPHSPHRQEATRLGEVLHARRLRSQCAAVAAVTPVTETAAVTPVTGSRAVGAELAYGGGGERAAEPRVLGPGPV